MAPRSSSPTSLLWAHQLKREHGYLLKRMQDLESASEEQESRIKTAETAAKANASGDISALAKEVKALDPIKKRLNDMETNVTQKLDDVQAENEAMTLQIAELKKDERMAEEERKKNFTKDKALLKRIGEVEEGLKKYEQSLDRIGKRINETQFEQIKQQLDSLTKQVKQEGSQMKMLTESVNALEAANVELSKANERLEAELKKKASKPPAQPVQAKAQSPVEDAVAGAEASPDAAEAETSKKKSHKWVGGGADKDIIRQGSGLVESSPITVSKPPPKASTVPKRPAPAPKKAPARKKLPIKKKPAVPKTPGPASDRKSHKWAGGGADRTIIQAGLSQDPIVKREPSDDEEEGPPRKKARLTSSGKEIIRSGKGWYEVARSLSVESEASGAPLNRENGRLSKDSAPSQDSVTSGKRKRGRPRKHPLPSQEQAGSTVQATATRRTIHQNQDHAASKEHTPEETRREPNIFSSPVSSSSPTPGGDEAAVPQASKNVLPGAATSRLEQALPKPRRQIVQLNDDISAIARQMSG